MNNKKKHTNSIFEEDFWLNIVAKDKWERINVIKKNGDIAACFPIYKTRYMGFKILKVPPFTQTLGVYIEDTGAKLSKALEREKKLLNSIIEQLPKKCNYDFYLDVNNKYILPFIWSGFKVEPMYSYRIESLDSLENVWSGFKENVRTDIKKAEKRLTVVDTEDIDILIKMLKKTFRRQNRSLPINEEDIKKLDLMLCNQNARKLLYAVDNENNIHAAAYFVFDENRCYYLFGGGDPNFRNSGAQSLLIWEGIKLSINRVEIFDFEGSMIESIERFNRAFGAVPKVYYHVYRMNLLLSIVGYLKPKVKKLLKYK